MVEPLRQAVLDRDQDAQDYKPLALLAVAAFVVSLLFALVVVTLTVWGLVSRKPFLEPWLILVAIGGVLLSIAGRWQISLSEGTREGRRLVNIAWWLSLIGGAMYAAYYFGNIYAIQGQARRFVKDALLARLKEQKVEAAFAATLRPNQRRGMTNLEEVRRRFGDIVAPFRMEPLPRMYERAGGIAEVEDIGTAQWDQKADGLTVYLRFMVRTPEGSFEVIVPAVGVENAETGEREWFVERQNVGVKPVTISTYGALTSGLQEEADGFMVSWMHDKRYPGRRAAMYYDTVPMSKEERRQRVATFIAAGLMGPKLHYLTATPFGGFGPLTLVTSMRNYDGTLRDHEPDSPGIGRKLVRWDESRQKLEKPELKDHMLPLILLPDFTQGSMQASMLGAAKTTLEVTPKRIRASMPIEVSLPILNYRCNGRIYADCTDAGIIEELMKRKSTVAEGTGDEAVPILKSMRHEWVISEMVIDLARDMGDQRPAAGGPSKMTGTYGSK
jgi:hypothetical protein